MIKKVKETIRKYGLIRRGDTVIAGVSGGPDSVAMLYALQALRKEFGFRLHVAHLDHMSRNDSAKDAAFVEALAERLRIPVTIVKIDVALRHCLTKGSFEEAARQARFEFLFELAKEKGAHRVALGHTLDDQAETVLMRMLRGTGLYGVSAIAPKRLLFGQTVIRPMRYVRRKEIERYLKSRCIIPRRDKTNNQEKYFRNRVRKTLLPLLEKKFNSNIKESLCIMADTVSCDYDYLKGVVEKKLQHVRKGRIPLVLLRAQHPSLRRLMLRFAIAQVKDDMRAITFKHICEIEDLVISRPEGSIVDLPKQVSVTKNKNCLFFRLRVKR